MKKPSKQRTAQALAIELVQKWFDDLMTSRDVLAFPDDGQFSFEDIEKALTREHEIEHGKIRPDQDLIPLEIASEAGYLVGVQVGLRLRGER